MPPSENSRDSEQELRWRAWQEKNRRADRIADKWMKVLFTVAGVILLISILYVWHQSQRHARSDAVRICRSKKMRLSADPSSFLRSVM